MWLGSVFKKVVIYSSQRFLRFQLTSNLVFLSLYQYHLLHISAICSGYLKHSLILLSSAAMRFSQFLSKKYPYTTPNPTPIKNRYLLPLRMWLSHSHFRRATTERVPITGIFDKNHGSFYRWTEDWANRARQYTRTKTFDLHRREKERNKRRCITTLLRHWNTRAPYEIWVSSMQST